jgi:hypothetical protein
MSSDHSSAETNDLTNVMIMRREIKFEMGDV